MVRLCTEEAKSPNIKVLAPQSDSLSPHKELNTTIAIELTLRHDRSDG